jgi:hypothetical protein
VVVNRGGCGRDGQILRLRSGFRLQAHACKTPRYDGHDFAWRCRPLALFIPAHPRRGCASIGVLEIGSSGLIAVDHFSYEN